MAMSVSQLTVKPTPIAVRTNSPLRPSAEMAVFKLVEDTYFI